MAESNEKDIRKRFDEISKYTISPEVTTCDLERVRRKLTEQPVAPQAMRPTIWRMIMNSRMTKPAAAAVIIIGALLGVTYFNVDGTSVAWAEVSEKVQQVRTYMFKGWTSTTGNMPGAEHMPKVETVTYMDSEYGMRNETYMNDKLSFIMYMNPHKEWMVSVMPETKSYMRVKVPDEQSGKMRQQSSDPREIVKQFTSFGYTELGRDTIDGIEVEGIAVDDPRILGGMFDSFKGRLWVDVQTDLPVKIEYEGSMLNGEMQMKITMGEFQWDLELDPDLFEPNIPDDYTLMAEMQIPGTKDKDVDKVIEALRLFSKIADGKYPSSLSMMTSMKEFGEAMKKATEAVDAITDEALRAEAKESLGEILGFEHKHNKEPGKKPSPEQMKAITSMMMTMQTPTTFYMQLVQQDKDPAYYGDKVSAEDTEAVLLRWKVSDTEYQVIFGDLTTKNVTAEQLAELEQAISP